MTSINWDYSEIFSAHFGDPGPGRPRPRTTLGFGGAGGLQAAAPGLRTSSVPPSTQVASRLVRNPGRPGALALSPPSTALSPPAPHSDPGAPGPRRAGPHPLRAAGSQSAPGRLPPRTPTCRPRMRSGAPGLPAPRGMRPVRRRGGRCECVCAGEKMAAAGEAA